MASPMQTMLQRHVEAGTIPGAVALVGRGDEVRTEVVGTMSLDGPPMRADAIMRIQSMTKPITTVLALLAVQDGIVTLDDPVDRWLPELTNPMVLRAPDAELADAAPATRPIQVRDLLTNGSGYGIQFGETPLARAVAAAGLEAGADPVAIGADDWLRRLGQLPLAHPPGEGFRYHHSFAILGILLQRVAGTALDDQLQRALCEPLGMVDTSLSVPRDQADRLPAAYRHEDGILQEVEPLGGGFYVGEPPFDTAHGELVSTAADFHRFARMLADGGRHDGEPFLAADLVAAMTRDQVPPVAKTAESFFPGFWDGMGWGYGVGIQTGGAHQGRFGWSGGQGTDFFVDPDATIAILLTQVELGEQMWGVLGEFQEVAGAAFG